jgi:isopentenyl-diphosphate Delta-isomerase
MKESSTVQRKKEHIELCLNDNVSFEKSNGFDHYEFEHFAITEVEFSKIDLSISFFGSKIDLPFLISCMTGGTSEAEAINEKLAIVAKNLNIPIGVGSQRQAVEEKKYHSTYRVIKKNAGKVPVLGNLGAAQLVRSNKTVDEIKFLVDLIEANAMVIHLNPLQELLQPEGEPNFKGLLKTIEKLTSQINLPFIAKEVGSGISKSVAKKLLNAGVQGIDVAGAGGTSWASIELLRKGENDDYFKEWGLPTSYCIRTIRELKKNFNFLLISSGGINNGIDIAKSIALGADMAASARSILTRLLKDGIDETTNMIINWFITVRKIMYLTGCTKLNQLKGIGLIRKEEFY